MKPVRDIQIIAVLTTILSGIGCAAGAAARLSPQAALPVAGAGTAPASRVTPKVCVDVQSQDALTVKFANLLSHA